MTPLPYPEPPLAAPGLVLRPFRAADLGAAAGVTRGAAESRFVEDLPEKDGEAVAREAEAHRLEGTMLQLVIASATTDAYLGEVSLVTVDPGAAELGCAVIPSARRNGVAKAAFRLASDWALEELGLRRLQAMVEPSNEPALRLAEGAGYRREGILRSYWEVDGELLDAILLSRLPSDSVTRGSPSG